jgi:hypothetical protein
MAIRSLESESLDKFLDHLNRSPVLVVPYLQIFMEKSLSILHDEVAPYPPATEANMPGRKNADGEFISYYERGKGSWRPVKRDSTLKKHITVKNIGRSLGRGVIPTPQYEIAGYVLRPTSEQLGKNWNTQVYIFGTEVLGEISNPTSYGDYVQGFSQAGFHGERGWITVQDALIKVEPLIYQVADQTFDTFIEQEL